MTLFIQALPGKVFVEEQWDAVGQEQGDECRYTCINTQIGHFGEEERDVVTMLKVKEGAVNKWSLLPDRTFAGQAA